MHPAKHNLFDCLDRDLRTYLPLLSSTRIGRVKRVLKVGRFRVPLGKPAIRLLRKSRPFWSILGARGIWSTVLRVPITFPPDRFYGAQLAAISGYWDGEFQPGIYTALLMGLADNDTRLVPNGNAGVVAAVESGEADVGLTDTDYVWAAQAQGRDVQLIYPAHSNKPGATGIGTLLIPNTVGLVKGGPNPQEARRFIDFLLSERVERMLAESVSHNVPLRPGLAADYPDFAVPDPLRIDYRLAAAQRDEAVALAMRYLKSRHAP